MGSSRYNGLFVVEGADPGLKDKKGRNSLDPARVNPKNKYERLRHGPIYKNPDEVEDLQRVIVVKLQSQMKREDVRDARSPRDSQLPRGCFEMTQSLKNASRYTTSFYQHDSDYDLFNEQKAIARLDRGPHFQVTSTMSGWNGDMPNAQTLDEIIWTPKVKQICEIINFRPQSNPRLDTRYPCLKSSEKTGSFNASHAEKQLVASYLDRHLLLEWDLRGIATSPLLQKLVTVRPTAPPPPANILINGDDYKYCENVIQHVQDIFRVEIKVMKC